MSEKPSNKSTDNVISIREHLKGSLGPEHDSLPVSSCHADSQLIQSVVRNDLLLSIEALTYETKILQAKAFLEQGRIADAKMIFKSAMEEHEAIPKIYLRITDLLTFDGGSEIIFLNEFQKLTADLIADIELTYLNNATSKNLEDFLIYYERIAQFAFNCSLVDQAKNKDLLFEIMQKYTDLLSFVSLQNYDEVKTRAEEIIQNLKKIGNIT